MGENDEVEEYSAYFARKNTGVMLNEVVDSHVMVAGIASEFCVLETIRELVASGKKVTVLKDGLGYVDSEGHSRALSEYVNLGVTFK